MCSYGWCVCLPPSSQYFLSLLALSMDHWSALVTVCSRYAILLLFLLKCSVMQHMGHASPAAWSSFSLTVIMLQCYIHIEAIFGRWAEKQFESAIYMYTSNTFGEVFRVGLVGTDLSSSQCLACWASACQKVIIAGHVSYRRAVIRSTSSGLFLRGIIVARPTDMRPLVSLLCYVIYIYVYYMYIFIYIYICIYLFSHICMYISYIYIYVYIKGSLALGPYG